MPRAGKISHDLIIRHEYDTNKWVCIIKFDTIIKWAEFRSTRFFLCRVRVKVHDQFTRPMA